MTSDCDCVGVGHTRPSAMTVTVTVTVWATRVTRTSADAATHHCAAVRYSVAADVDGHGESARAPA